MSAAKHTAICMHSAMTVLGGLSKEILVGRQRRWQERGMHSLEKTLILLFHYSCLIPNNIS